jgi:hypothetical protein
LRDMAGIDTKVTTEADCDDEKRRVTPRKILIDGRKSDLKLLI